MLKMRILALVFVMVVVGCSSVGQVGMMVGPSSNPGSVIKQERSYSELGPVFGRACRYFLLAVIPWGDSTPTAAMQKALSTSGGDAIINASVETSLYVFIPIYNVFSFTCTTVRGIAIKFDDN